ncbi:retrovirus-related pol polyprotein from transposon TNT 1-94 [Tanacetum coccineum]
MFTEHIQELLVYVSKRCLDLPKPSEKLVAVTPLNKNKRVRFAKPVISSSNIPKQTDSLKTKDSNKPLLTSTGVKPTTSASESKPSGNTKNNRITRPSSNQKNKVEDHSRKVKSSLNKINSISEPNSNALVKRNAKFESICAICNKCLFDANHDMCIIDYVNDVNVHSKSKSKRNKMRQVWKPTGKVFIEIGYSWKPTGRTFTIVGNRCPLTRITSNKIVPPKETIIAPVVTRTSGILVYNRRPKATRFVGSNSKVKIVESKTSNSKEPKQSWGSTVSDVLLLLLTIAGSPNCSLYQKDHLFSACALGKSKKHSHKPKAEDSIQEKLYLLHMDLCGPMRTQSINGRKYIVMIQVHLNATVHNMRTDNGTKFVNHTLNAYYEEVRISHQTSMARTPQQNNVVERRNHTLVEAARTMLIFSKAPLFLWAEAVATACYTQNRSLIRKHHNKTPYELFNDQKPDLSYLHVFRALCYPTNDSEDLEVDHDIEVAHMDNNPNVDFPIPEPSSEESSTQVVIPNNVHSINQPSKHINKWTKDHPIDNVISDPSRPVSTRHQLQDEALFCYFDAFLSFVEPKSYKEALTESCWIEAMQEELNKFERLEVWKLVWKVISHKRTKNKAKNDKTEHGMEKCEKMKPNQSQKVNPVKKSTEKSNSQSQVNSEKLNQKKI